MMWWSMSLSDDNAPSKTFQAHFGWWVSTRPAILSANGIEDPWPNWNATSSVLTKTTVAISVDGQLKEISW
jgi:hypothetical protein